MCFCVVCNKVVFHTIKLFRSEMRLNYYNSLNGQGSGINSLTVQPQGKWLNRWRCCDWIGRLPFELLTRPINPALLRGSQWPSGQEKVRRFSIRIKAWRLTLFQWGFTLGSGPELAVGQSSSTQKRFYWEVSYLKKVWNSTEILPKQFSHRPLRKWCWILTALFEINF